MNERIRELAEQAGITTNLNSDYFEKDINRWVDYYSEKFAELIVKECIKVIHEWKREPFPLEPDDAARLLREHFGIEQ
jgi:hypothetical protein